MHAVVAFLHGTQYIVITSIIVICTLAMCRSYICMACSLHNYKQSTVKHFDCIAIVRSRSPCSWAGLGKIKGLLTYVF